MSLDSGNNLIPPEYKSSVAAPALDTPSTDSYYTVFPQGDGNHTDSNLISNQGQNHIIPKNAQPFQENSGRDSLASKPEQSADVRQNEKSNTNLESENILSNALLDIQLVVLGDSGVTRETARNLLKDKSTLDGAQASSA